MRFETEELVNAFARAIAKTKLADERTRLEAAKYIRTPDFCGMPSSAKFAKDAAEYLENVTRLEHDWSERRTEDKGKESK